jgi:K+/H+ antiporter YhaU regulatory subunit KhtT
VVLLRRRDEDPDFHPGPDRRLKSEDTIAVLGGASQISTLAKRNGQY